MKKIHNYLILAFIVSILVCCRYDKIEPKCETLPDSQKGYDYTYSTYNYAPSFNPNNPNEIAFYRTLSSKIEICTYNLLTNKVNVVYSPPTGFGTGTPEWGNDNWIFFPMKDRQIWKIKANGDSLMQITQRIYNLSPKNNTIQKKMICENICFGCYNPGTSETTDKRDIFVYNKLGLLLDSMPLISSIAPFAWQNSDNIALFSHLDPSNPIGTVQVLNSNTKERTDIGTYNFNGNSENGLCWIDNNTLIYMLEDGIYKIDVAAKKTTQLRVTCETKNYGSPSYSPALNKIIATKTILKIVGENLVEITNKLCLMDTEGNEEREVLIPE